MKEYIVKRVFLAVVTIFVISAITFFAMNLIPGGPFNTEKALSPAVQKTLEERYNLDKPVYFLYDTGNGNAVFRIGNPAAVSILFTVGMGSGLVIE